MLDYDQEAERYDDLRGGEPRAAAAAEAVLALLPDGCRTLLDAACGTGIVTRRLAAARPGTRVVGADLSFEMTRRAARGCPARWCARTPDACRSPTDASTRSSPYGCCTSPRTRTRYGPWPPSARGCWRRAGCG